MGLGASHVVVDGTGPVADESAVQLRRHGVTVHGGAQAADAAELALAEGAAPPGLVVLVTGTAGRVPHGLGAPWLVRGIPHLPVADLDRGLTVGPLVLPGRSPCLQCAPGTAAPGPPVGPSGAGPAPVVLAAALVTVTALAVLRGDDSLAGISTEIGPGATSVVYRLWHAAPGCRCLSVRMAG